MKKLLQIVFLTVVFARLSLAQPVDTYANNTGITAPPTLPPAIDAIHFENNAPFRLVIGGTIPFDFLDVLTYTNRSIMSCDLGFVFDHQTNDVNDVSTRELAFSFGNGNQGQIFAGSTNATPATFQGFGVSFIPRINIAATNIVNSGVLDVDVTGLINIIGEHLNLSRGTVHVEGFSGFPGSDSFTNPPITSLGIFPAFHGQGRQSNALSIGNFLSPFSAPMSNVTNTLGTATNFTVMPGPDAGIFVFTNMVNPSNFSYQIVVINTNLSGVSTDVRFAPNFNGPLPVPIPIDTNVPMVPTIQWSAVVSNSFGQPIATNFLYLQDAFGHNPTNTQTNINFTLSGSPLIEPYNYFISPIFNGFNALSPANATFSPAVLAGAFPETNAYSTLGVSVQPSSFVPDGSSFFVVTNLPGRVTIAATNAGSTLDLTRAHITGANYLSISATNHFISASNAEISAPNMELNLGSTNGNLAMNGVVSPLIARLNGSIALYSARWTNIDMGTNMAGSGGGGITNTYHVLFVDGEFSPSTAIAIQNLTLRSTNVVINDVINVISNLSIIAENLTIASNEPGPLLTVTGQLINLNTAGLWPVSVPILQNFTNLGLIDAVAELQFYKLTGAPYKTFVNRGEVLASGVSVRSEYLENSGGAIIETTAGPIQLMASNAVLTDSFIATEGSDVSIGAFDLTILNESLQLSGSLTFSVTNSLTDGGVGSGNLWEVGDGINLLVKPALGDFLGTTVTLTAPAGLEVANAWAGSDRGVSENGFLNNGALGDLILNGLDNNSEFFFSGPDNATNYALYVDRIELQGGATNRITQNGVQIFTTFDIAPNMTIYFADAVIGQTDISEKLNGANNGHLVWVSSHAGAFSGTNFLDGDGNTSFVNNALLQSSDIDSDGDGTFNKFDTTPFLTPAAINPLISFKNVAPMAPVISWRTVQNSTNTLYFMSNLFSTNVVVVTNFVAIPGNPSFIPANSTARVTDSGRTNTSGFYKVRVAPRLP